MSTLDPFPARIVRAEWAEHVVSPMHDALSREERAAILAERPYSWLHVSRTPEDAVDGQEVDPEVLDEANSAALDRLLGAGLFEEFPEPALYVYRLRSDDHEQTGIVGEVPPQAFVDGRVLGHEGVQPERVDALGLHLARLGARSTLVALMFRADDDIRKIVEATTDGAPLRRFGTGDLEQTVWRIDDPGSIERIRERLDHQPLYITDGHHRAMASVELWEAAGSPEGAGVPAVLFPEDAMRMLAFHRRVVGPLPMSVDELLSRVGERVRVEDGETQPVERGVFGLYAGGRWYRLVPRRDDAAAGVESRDVERRHPQGCLVHRWDEPVPVSTDVQAEHPAVDRLGLPLLHRQALSDPGEQFVDGHRKRTYDAPMERQHPQAVLREEDRGNAGAVRPAS